MWVPNWLKTNEQTLKYFLCCRSHTISMVHSSLLFHQPCNNLTHSSWPRKKAPANPARGQVPQTLALGKRTAVLIWLSMTIYWKTQLDSSWVHLTGGKRNTDDHRIILITVIFLNIALLFLTSIKKVQVTEPTRDSSERKTKRRQGMGQQEQRLLHFQQPGQRHSMYELYWLGSLQVCSTCMNLM